MAEQTNTTTAPRESRHDLIGQLHAAGVDNELIMRVFERMETDRAETIAKTARLFYHPNNEHRPMTIGDFSDQFNNMTRRMWGLVAAVSDVLGDHSDSVGPGVLQLVEDVAREMERLAEAFDAERWMERQRKAQS